MRIPTDLKPGDRLWYSKTEYATAAELDGELYRDDPKRIMSTKGDLLMIYDCVDGSEMWHETPPIIRIERIASKPKRAKVDADAKWLLSLTMVMGNKPMDDRHPADLIVTLTRSMRRRLRAIASRLENGK